MSSVGLPPCFNHAELITLRHQNGRYIFPDGTNARIAKATDQLGRIVATEVTHLNDFLAFALSDDAPLFMQPTMRRESSQLTHFTVTHPAKERADPAEVAAFMMESVTNLNRWLRALVDTPLQPYLLVQDPRNRLAALAALWDSTVSDGSNLYPVVRNTLGNKGRLPKDARYIKRPLAQRAGIVDVIWDQAAPPPVTKQDGYGNLRTGYGNFRGGRRMSF